MARQLGFPRFRRLLARSAACLRAGVTLFVLAALALAGLGKSAEARIGERLLDFGNGLLRLESFRASSAPRRLTVNGLEAGVLTLSTPLDVSAALDRFQALCSTGIEGAAALDKLPATTSAALGGLRDGVLRRESAREGFVVCLDTGGKLELSELVLRLQALQKTGDLAALGSLRYVLAKRSGSRTALLVLWTEGALPLFHAFPEGRDAPGRDPEGVPRPERVERLLSAAEHGAPYAVTLYRAQRRPARELLDWYGEKLEKAGWAVARSAAEAVIVARRSGRVLAVHVTTNASGETSIGIAEL